MMTRMFLGEETFKKGLTNYLKKLSYSNAASDDLFRELTEQAKSDGKDINVKDIMDTWILQMNYPVVTVSRDAHNTIQVSQKRFLSDPRVEDPGRYISPFNYSWTIPLTFTSSTDPWFGHNDTDVHWLYKHEPTKTFNISIKLPDNEDTDGWILANVQQYGFYRVNYKNSNWLALSRQLKRNHSVIPAANREQIINDAWSLARARHIQVDTALATVEYLDKERDYIPWSAALEGLDFLDSMLYNTTFHGAFQKFMQDKLTDPFNHFGLVHISRDHVDILSQVLIARKSCHYGIPTCQNEAIRQYNLWMNSAGHKPIDPNFRTNIYCNAIANGNETEWMFALQVMVSTEKRIQNDLHRQKFTLVKMYKNAERASEKVSLLSAMACSKLPDILNKYMKRTLEEDSPFSEVDSKRVVAAVALRHHGRRLAWNFIKENFGELTKTFSYFDFQKILSTCIGSFKTEEDIHEVEETGQKLGLPSEVVSPAVQVIRDNINWIQTNAPIITKWLKDRNYLTEQSPRL